MRGSGVGGVSNGEEDEMGEGMWTGRWKGGGWGRRGRWDEEGEGERKENREGEGDKDKKDIVKRG